MGQVLTGKLESSRRSRAWVASAALLALWALSALAHMAEARPPDKPSPQAAADPHSVTWLLADFPPVSVPVNGKPTDGITDQMLRYLVAHWPEARHHYLATNAKRGVQLIESGEHVCHGTLIRTPGRERSAYFVNTYLLPPLQLIVRREQLEQIPRSASGEADLERLIATGGLRGVFTSGRSYSPAIDAQLGAALTEGGGDGGSVTRYSPSDFGARQMLMISKGRADYTIDYDFTLRYLSEHNPEMGALTTVPVAGSSDMFLAGIACPRTPWGRETIRRIEQLLRNPQAAEVIRIGLYRWLTPEVRRAYGDRIDAFYRDFGNPKLHPSAEF